MIRVMVVDDDALVRMGLVDLLGTDPDLEVVAEAADGRQALDAAAAQRVDVALVDVRMPVMNGIAATARLRALPRPPRVVVLTTFDVDEYVYRALAAGADGFLLKDTEPREILRAVHVVASGSAILHPSAARTVIDRFHTGGGPAALEAQTRVRRLTPRETQVLALVGRGATNAEVADELGMREATVKAHVSRILEALHVTNRVQAALVARDAGLGSP
ncbi:response regulator transcription factor [Arthrobacter sp. NEB 688]|nr:response regulator transcription factor [Arthrobacter sp. NEB 688]